MRAANVSIAAAGAAVILFAAAGLWEIESGAGPYAEPLSPAPLGARPEGELRVTPPSGTPAGGLCVPEPPAAECAPARTELDLAVAGLPPLDPHAKYTVVLTGPDVPWEAGTLAPDGPTHTLSVADDRDGREFAALSVLARPMIPAGAATITVLTMALPDGDRASIDLSALAEPGRGPVDGRLRATEIGAFSISVTVVGEVEGLPPLDGWRYEAWLEPRDAGPWIRLGPLESREADGGTHVLDGRVERLRLEDQARVVLTVLPAGAEASGEMQGLPLYQVPLGETGKAPV